MDELSPPIHDPPNSSRVPTRYRVPIGLPVREERRRAGVLISVLVHAFLIGLMIAPFFLPSSVIVRMQQGAGGSGPTGGGGGGSRGMNEGTRETLRFVKVSTQHVATPSALPPIPAPIPSTVPTVTRIPTLPLSVIPPQQKTVAPSSPDPHASNNSGSGNATGSAGPVGAGPGNGGGVGSGIGSGTGSSNGPGTNGGTQSSYPPQPIAVFLPPLPAPRSVRGFQFVAEFDVDSTGRVLDVKFTDTPDGSYNRQIASVLRSIRFRPGTRPDGTPQRMKAQIGFGF